MTDPREIAARLTPEQAAHLAEIVASPHPVAYAGFERAFPAYVLRQKGLVEWAGNFDHVDHAFTATDFGREVAAALREAETP